jgi:gas vesicle protein
MANKKLGLGCFLAGAGIGAVTALLYAPRAGKHTRQRIRNSANDVRAYVSERVDETSETLASTIAAGRGALGKVRERVEEGRDRVGEFVRSVAR